MGRTWVGAVGSIWRYPVKSMHGEEIDSSAIGLQGLVGDRSQLRGDHVGSGRLARRFEYLANHCTPHQCDSRYSTLSDAEWRHSQRRSGMDRDKPIEGSVCSR